MFPESKMFAESDVRVKETLFRLRRPLLIALLTIALAAGAGLLSAARPLLGGGLLLAIAVLASLFVQPETATLITVFILYTNVAAVANKFHGVPYVVASSFPLLLFIPVVKHVFINREKIVLPRTLPLLLGFLSVQFLGTILSRDAIVSARSVLNFILEGLLIYVLLTNVVRTRRTLRRVTWVLLLAGVALAAFPLWQLATQSYDDIFYGFAQLSDTAFRTGQETVLGAVRQFRSAGAIGEQNRYAQIMLMLAPLGFFTFMAERQWVLRLMALLATIMALVGVTLTFSRGAAVAIVLLLLAAAALRVINFKQLAIILLLIVGLLVALPQYRTRLVTVTQIYDIMVEGKTSILETDSSFQGRRTEMLAALLVFADHPLIGVGPGMFKYYSQEYGNDLGLHALEGNREAHSLYLDIAANYGVLGLLTFFGIFAVLIRQLLGIRRRLREQDPTMARMATGYLLAILSYLATGLFLHLSYVRYLWLMVALASAMCHIALREESERQSLEEAPANDGHRFNGNRQNHKPLEEITV